MAGIFVDFLNFVEGVRVRVGDGRLLNLELTQGQERCLREIEKEWGRGVAAQVTCYKGRKRGFTTLAAALCAWTVYRRGGVAFVLQPEIERGVNLGLVQSMKPKEAVEGGRCIFDCRASGRWMGLDVNVLVVDEIQDFRERITAGVARSVVRDEPGSAFLVSFTPWWDQAGVMRQVIM